MKSHLVSWFWGGITDPAGLMKGLQKIIDSLPPVGIFAGDNLFAFGRNLSFLDDAGFMRAFERHATDDMERAIVWRTHTLCWAARHCVRLDGDFVEAGCFRGTTARIVCDYVDFAATAKGYYLYDLFTWGAANEPADPPPDGGPYEQVRRRFADLPSVRVVRGALPETLGEATPERVALLHLDLNDAGAELDTLERLFDRVVPGGLVVLDDYGWYGYRASKLAEDPFFAARGYAVLEMPTGQGLVIKRAA